jgi:hypothetical protein
MSKNLIKESLIEDLVILTGHENETEFLQAYDYDLWALISTGMTRKEAIKMTLLQLIHNA